jgi:photosystem II stability/assembly factor-like uncharacterized protein
MDVFLKVSDDGGTSWRNAGLELPFPGWVVGSLKFDPDRPERLWAALWGIWGGGLVASSDDLGATWELRPLGQLAEAQVYALARPPGRPERLVLGTRAGVLISDDLGKSYRAVGRDVAGLVHVSSLYVDPAFPERIVAGTWRRAYRSDDGGVSWRGIFEGMVLDTEVFSLSAVPGREGELWASSCGWVYRGDRWGELWSRRQNGLAERRTPSFGVLSAERLLAGTVAGAYLSTDGGASFRRTSRPDLAVLAIAQHPARPERVLLGTEGSGIWMSSDGGESFAARPVGMRNVRVPALARLGEQVFAALAHAGPSSGVFRSPDGGISFEPLPAELPTVLDLAATGERLYAATERGLFERAGEAWRRLAEAGERRIDQLAVFGPRLAVRAAGALFEHAGAGKLRPIPFTFRDPLAVALAGDDLWVLRDDGLFRLSGGKPQAWSVPYRGGGLLGAAGELVYFGAEGTHLRDGREGAWAPVARGASRALGTGDARYPLVTVERSGGIGLSGAGASPGASVSLYDRDRNRLRAIATPFPPAETLSALIVGDRLLLGTSGYGLWEGQLPD